MNEAVYQSAIGDSDDYNANLLKHEQDEAWEDELSEQLMREEQVITVTFIASLTEAFQDSMESLNVVVVVLIIAAAGLAFVVLYNLTNINVSERIRELSTIKVLGFYDKEVTLYIYRETILLTILGILVGFGIGEWLHQFIITVVPPEDVMFNPALSISSFIIPTVVISIVTLILGFVINRRLKNVDMLEALKSVD